MAKTMFLAMSLMHMMKSEYVQATPLIHIERRSAWRHLTLGIFPLVPRSEKKTVEPFVLGATEMPTGCTHAGLLTGKRMRLI